MEGERQRIAQYLDAGDAATGFFQNRIVDSNDDRRLRRWQQPGQVVEHDIEQLARLPRAARTNTVIGAPVLKLASAGADRGGG